MTRDETVYGYKNIETATIILYLDNDQHQHTMARAAAGRFMREPSTSAVWTQEESACFGLADYFKETFDQRSARYFGGSRGTPEPFLDLIARALDRVNWVEIAEHFIAGEQEEQDYVRA